MRIKDPFDKAIAYVRSQMMQMELYPEQELRRKDAIEAVALIARIDSESRQCLCTDCLHRREDHDFSYRRGAIYDACKLCECHDLKLCRPCAEKKGSCIAVSLTVVERKKKQTAIRGFLKTQCDFEN